MAQNLGIWQRPWADRRRKHPACELAMKMVSSDGRTLVADKMVPDGNAARAPDDMSHRCGLTCGTMLAPHAPLDHGSRCGRDAAQHRASKLPP